MSNSHAIEHVSTVDTALTPCLFNWTEGGNEVYLIGSFINWDLDKKIPMKKINGESFVILLLTKNVHTYKFLVDGKQKCSSLTNTVKKATGEMHNIINVKTYTPFNFELKNNPSHLSYEKVWKQIKMDNFDCADSIIPIPIYLEYSQNIIYQNICGPSLVSEPLCNHLYFDMDTNKEPNCNIIEVCVVHLSKYKDNTGRNKKIFTKYNILTNIQLPKTNDQSITHIDTEEEKKSNISTEEEKKNNLVNEKKRDSEKEMVISNPLKHFIAL